MSFALAVSRRTAADALRRAPRVTGAGASVAAGGARGMSASPALKGAYKYVWRSNVTNVTYVVVGAVVVEMLYGMVGDSIFDMANKGKQYHDTDWTKFKEEDEDEEEEEEEEDE